MSVRERVAAGRSVRIKDLADEVGLPIATIYSRVRRGELEHIRCGRAIVITARGAKTLLEVGESVPAHAAA